MSTKKQAKKKAPRQKLTPKRERFVDHYIANGGNGAKAAKDAGYAQKTARVEAARLLTNANIQRRIAERIDDAASVSANEVIGTLAAQMRADATDLFDESGAFDIEKLREARLGHLIKKIKVKRYAEGPREAQEPVDIIEIELHSQQAAAVQLCKVLGIEQEPARNKGELARKMLRKLISAGKTKEQAAADLLRCAVKKEDVQAALAEIEAHEHQSV